MGPDADLHFASCLEDIRVMENLLSQGPHLVGKGQGLGEVLETVFLLQVMAVDDLPVIAEFGVEVFQCLAGERWQGALLRLGVRALSWAHAAHFPTGSFCWLRVVGCAGAAFAGDGAQGVSNGEGCADGIGGGGTAGEGSGGDVF